MIGMSDGFIDRAGYGISGVSDSSSRSDYLAFGVRFVDGEVRLLQGVCVRTGVWVAEFEYCIYVYICVYFRHIGCHSDPEQSGCLSW
jgi:hypothetical protein